MSKHLIGYVPSDTDKTRALGDVFYEIQQLWFSSRQLSTDQLMRNAYIESFLVHVRALLNFFEGSARSTYMEGSVRREHDDVLARDYGFAPRPIDLAKIYRDRLNKDLAHVSYSRCYRLVEGREWPLRYVVIPIIERAMVFIDFMNDERLAATPGVTPHQWRELRQNLETMFVEHKGRRGDTHHLNPP